MDSSLFAVFPWNPPFASASSAFWAVFSSAAVMVTVLLCWSHFPSTPGISLRIFPTAATQARQQRWTFVNSTFVSARLTPAQASSAISPDETIHRENCIHLLPFLTTKANANPGEQERSRHSSNLHRHDAIESRFGFRQYTTVVDVG